MVFPSLLGLSHSGSPTATSATSVSAFPYSASPAGNMNTRVPEAATVHALVLAGVVPCGEMDENDVGVTEGADTGRNSESGGVSWCLTYNCAEM